MNDNENWIGKKLISKDNPKVQHTVIGQDKSILLLDNNGRIDEARVSEVFNQQEVSPSLDPESFFDSGVNMLGSFLVNNIENPTLGRKTIGIPDSGSDVVEFKAGNPDAIRAFETGDYSRPPQKPTTPVYENTYGAEYEDSRPQSANPISTPADRTYYVNDDEETAKQGPSTVALNNTTAKKSIFDTMTLKKSTPIKIKLVIEEKIPKIDAIRNLNDLFDESIIEHLASEITNKFLMNPKLLQDLVAETLESVVYPKKKKTVAKKKPSVRKNSQAAKAKTNSKTTKTVSQVND
jgi:hypothetical protein